MSGFDMHVVLQWQYSPANTGEAKRRRAKRAAQATASAASSEPASAPILTNAPSLPADQLPAMPQNSNVSPSAGHCPSAPDDSSSPSVHASEAAEEVKLAEMPQSSSAFEPPQCCEAFMMNKQQLLTQLPPTRPPAPQTVAYESSSAQAAANTPVSKANSPSEEELQTTAASRQKQAGADHNTSSGVVTSSISAMPEIPMQAVQTSQEWSPAPREAVGRFGAPAGSGPGFSPVARSASGKRLSEASRLRARSRSMSHDMQQQQQQQVSLPNPFRVSPEALNMLSFMSMRSPALTQIPSQTPRAPPPSRTALRSMSPQALPHMRTASHDSLAMHSYDRARSASRSTSPGVPLLSAPESFREALPQPVRSRAASPPVHVASKAERHVLRDRAGRGTSPLPQAHAHQTEPRQSVSVQPGLHTADAIDFGRQARPSPKPGVSPNIVPVLQGVSRSPSPSLVKDGHWEKTVGQLETSFANASRLDQQLHHKAEHHCHGSPEKAEGQQLGNIAQPEGTVSDAAVPKPVMAANEVTHGAGHVAGFQVQSGEDQGLVKGLGQSVHMDHVFGSTCAML